ncbi:MAG: malto-oligosyltrehalose trehalohydrolase [Gemmatimonadetes bacterium]|nr:malto-oligosyltrehalose trehalohydrolase [Gemmatimonadota bacterium]
MPGTADLRPVGARPSEGGTDFRVWAPASSRADVVLYGPASERVAVLEAEEGGWFAGRVPDVGAGARYRWRLDGADTWPDPASRYQPDGVHGTSEVVDPAAFRWTDGGWRGLPLEEMVLYEVHVGTATPQGTFDALIPRLDALRDLGVTALELMPVADFPGDRNWGYDGVYPYAPARAYGGPEGLRRLVDAAHARGLAVVLDVVYNHLGPEGNYLHAVTGGRFFTPHHKTPWGDGINYDGEGSAAVRGFVIGNALHWLREHHVDGLRLDATHAILDDGNPHLLAELADALRDAVPAGRRFVLFAEDERNERRVVTLIEEGGLGIHAVWADDFHHQVRALAAGDREAYFADYAGTVEDLSVTLRKGWLYEGQESPNHARARGTPADGIAPPRFVHCIQNHDQVGNRALGTRLGHDVPPAVYRATSALLLLSPYTPLLWMGQEWDASAPFLFFTDHPEELGHAVTEGRRREFAKFAAFSDPAARERIPDPQAEETFLRSKLDWDERMRQPHLGVLTLYRELLALRRSDPALQPRDRASFAVACVAPGVLALRRTGKKETGLLLVVSFDGPARISLNPSFETRPPAGKQWKPLLWTEDPRFGGGGGKVEVDKKGTLEIPGIGAAILRAK